ncbi:MAG: sigma-70 family RNA polymerase sigma factor [Flavobacteriales bacterium]|nr:sigma-70 family RNA polymerase sigma factor [Flavobacteriales bacterium]
MGPAHASDAELIAHLRKGTIEEDMALKQIYREHFHAVSGYVQRNSGDADAARDVFQDGVLVLYRNIKEDRFNGESAIGTYLYSICRYLWLKSLRKRGRISDDAEADLVSYGTPLIELIDAERRSMVLALFDQLGEACKRILLLSFYEDLDMREIAAHTGLKDEQNARNKKYKCLKGLKEKMDEHGGLAHWLNELQDQRS